MLEATSRVGGRGRTEIAAGVPLDLDGSSVILSFFRSSEDLR
jgi:hypothetical protein